MERSTFSKVLQCVLCVNCFILFNYACRHCSCRVTECRAPSVVCHIQQITKAVVILCCHASLHLKSFSLSPLFPVTSLSDDGVSIPCSYTSFLAPLSSSKLYNEVRGCRERDKDPECHFETPYVVRLHNFHQLADPKPCFTFTHPSTGRNKPSKLMLYTEKQVHCDRMCFDYGDHSSLLLSDMNNNRYQCLRFSVGCNSVLHGFAGYFETTLYKDVTLSKSSF